MPPGFEDLPIEDQQRILQVMTAAFEDESMSKTSLQTQPSGGDSFAVLPIPVPVQSESQDVTLMPSLEKRSSSEATSSADSEIDESLQEPQFIFNQPSITETTFVDHEPYMDRRLSEIIGHEIRQQVVTNSARSIQLPVHKPHPPAIRLETPEIHEIVDDEVDEDVISHSSSPTQGADDQNASGRSLSSSLDADEFYYPSSTPLLPATYEDTIREVEHEILKYPEDESLIDEEHSSATSGADIDESRSVASSIDMAAPLVPEHDQFIKETPYDESYFQSSKPPSEIIHCPPVMKSKLLKKDEPEWPSTTTTMTHPQPEIPSFAPVFDQQRAAPL